MKSKIFMKVLALCVCLTFFCSTPVTSYALEANNGSISPRFTYISYYALELTVNNGNAHIIAELNGKSALEDLIWDIGVAIKERKLAEISYERKSYNNQIIKRLVEPLSILFSEYYFYLLANFVEKDEDGKINKLYDYPAVLRIDRINKFKSTDETFYIE